ncbi:hypothetical protein SeLEV6574_g07197 [Synchytrium endobioticum]|nr:hypothetical protein SeLEV6574_g07197 [Synchytrium endobioticum]
MYQKQSVQALVIRHVHEVFKLLDSSYSNTSAGPLRFTKTRRLFLYIVGSNFNQLNHSPYPPPPGQLRVITEGNLAQLYGQVLKVNNNQHELKMNKAAMLQQFIDITDSLPTMLTYGESTRVSLSMPATGCMVLFVMRKMTDDEMLANLYAQTLQHHNARVTYRSQSNMTPRPFHERLEMKRPSAALPELIQSLQAIVAGSKLKAGVTTSDDDIQAGDTQVTFKCPLSLRRIQHPVKFMRCTHLQCTDALSMLALMAGNRKEMWKCVVCNKEASPRELIIDGAFKSVLAQYPIDEKCIVHPDGSTSSAASILLPLMTRPRSSSSSNNGSNKGTTTTEIASDADDDDIILISSNTASIPARPVEVIEID